MEVVVWSLLSGGGFIEAGYLRPIHLLLEVALVSRELHTSHTSNSRIMVFRTCLFMCCASAAIANINCRIFILNQFDA